jgi:hypothetical protein
MRTFAQKQNQLQKPVPSNLARSHATTPGLHHRADLILRVQRMIGNQAVQRMLQTQAEELKAGLTGTSSSHFGRDFSRIPIHTPATGAIQTKLAVNGPADEYEQEADRISEHVMRMPQPRLQRACACGGACPKCQTEQRGPEHERVHTKRVGSGDWGQAEAPPMVHEVLRSPGYPLDETTRAFMEPRLGHDFSNVRLHADSLAVDSARAIQARAYTVGPHIVFGAGQFAPQTQPGQRLLAHELTHVIQQTASHWRNTGPAIIQRDPDIPISRPPMLPKKIIHGSSNLSRVTQSYAADHQLASGTNLVAVEYSVGGSERQIKVFENRSGVAHTEEIMEQHFRDLRKPVTVYEVYSERQPCGFSEHNCEKLLLGDRYKNAEVTFGYNYQETPSPAPQSRAARSRDLIDAHHERVYKTKQLEWDFVPKDPPPHHEVLEAGKPSKRPRRLGSGGSADKPTARSVGKAAPEVKPSAVGEGKAATAEARVRPTIEPVATLGRVGVVDAALFYLQIHAAHFAALEAVSQRVEVAKNLINYVAEFEHDARALREAVNNLQTAESGLAPVTELLQADEQAPSVLVTFEELENIDAYADSAGIIVSYAFDADVKLNRVISGWDAVVTQAKETRDFTRSSAFDAITNLDLRFSKEGGNFRNFLIKARDDAVRVQAWARSKWNYAKDILKTANMPLIKGMKGIHHELTMRRNQLIAMGRGVEAGVLIAIDELKIAQDATDFPGPPDYKGKSAEERYGLALKAVERALDFLQGISSASNERTSLWFTQGLLQELDRYRQKED